MYCTMGEDFSNRNFKTLVFCLSQLASSVAAGRSWVKGEASGRHNGGWAEHSCLQCQQHYGHQFLHHKLHGHHQCLHCQHRQLHQQRKTGRSTDICLQRHTWPTDCTGASNNHLAESIHLNIDNWVFMFKITTFLFVNPSCNNPLTALHQTSLCLA